MGIIIEVTIKIILALLIAYVVPATLKWIKSKKHLAEERLISAENEGQKTEAENKITMLDYAQQVVVDLEDRFAEQDTVLKGINTALSLGSAKKDTAMSKLLGKSIQLGMKFDENFWSGAIDGLIDLSKKVNKRK